ncbi:MAG TPA: hypothetical protein VGF62_08730 [Rhizomicrobium sp.]
MKWRVAVLFSLGLLVGCESPQVNRAALPPTPPAGEPGNVAGMDATRIRLAFGTPQFVRKDGQVEMWRYDGVTCKAFFFMYPNGASLAVRHVETVPQGISAAADSACLQSLLARAKAVSG